MERTEIRSKVVSALSASLALEPSEVRDDSRLIQELGMDSLDFLDIMFSLEKEFGVELRNEEFDRLLRPDKSEAARAGEHLSEEERQKLLAFVPALGAVEGPVPRNALFSYITVETLVRMIEKRLN